MIEDLKKEKIAIETIKTLVSRFDTFPEDASNNRNAPFHTAFLNAFSDKLQNRVCDIPFFISLSSWFHGLSTTLGQSFFENIANALSDGNKKDFTEKRNSLLKVTSQQKQAISDIITDLKNGAEKPNVSRENNKISLIGRQADLDANNFTVDVYIETTTQITAIELKTVKPNAGEMRGEKQKILEAKAALFNEFPGREIKYYIAFPFDPTSDTSTGYNKTRFLSSLIDGNKYFASDEILLADELWNFLSDDKNTMHQILLIINAIATPKFMEKYSYLNKNNNRLEDAENYKNLLKEWFLAREYKLICKQEDILKITVNNKKNEKIYNQPIFKDGDYNSTRYEYLNSLI